MKAHGKHAFIRRNGDKAETISIIECISATGEVLNPIIIFKGKKIMTAWTDDIKEYQTVFRPNIAVSPNGWIDRSLGYKWEQTFVHAMKNRPGNKLLLFDGHDYHMEYDFAKLCQDNQIELLSFTPHTTDNCQSLDVGCFGPSKH
jgi:hypothetical protein